MYEGVSFIPLTWTDMLYLAPEFALAAMFLLLIVLDLLLPKHVSRLTIGWLTLAGLLVSLLLVVLRMLDMNQGGASSEAIRLLSNSYRIDDFSSLLKIVFLTGTSLIVLLAFIVLLGLYPSMLTDTVQHGIDGLFEQFLATRAGG